MAIRTLFVDLGGVVVSYDSGITSRGLAAHSGRTPEEVEDLIFQRLGKQFDEGFYAPREFYEKVLIELGTVIAEKEFWDLWRNIFSVNQDVLKVLREADSLGIEVIAASNVDPVRFEQVRTMGGLGPFIKLGLSFQMRARKPDKDFYWKLSEMTASRPQECLFIDDVEENVRAAAEFGFVVIHHRRADLLRHALQCFGVLP